MIKLFFLVMFFLIGAYSLKADEVPGENDQEFTANLDKVKNPFEDGFPHKPVVIISHPTPVYHEQMRAIDLPTPKTEQAVREDVKLPDLKLQGVIVGEDIYQAIINNQVVPLLGVIEGARVDSVSKEGVGLTFKGKKFFLKVD